MVDRENRRRILYVDDYLIGEDGYHEFVEDVEIFGLDGLENVRKLYDENQPYDLIGVHLSVDKFPELTNFLRERGRDVPILITSALREKPEDVKESLEDFFPSCDGIVWKNGWKEQLESILLKLVRELQRIETVQRELQNA